MVAETFGQERRIHCIDAHESIETDKAIQRSGLQVVLRQLLYRHHAPSIAILPTAAIMEERFAMSVEQAILEAVRALPADKQQEVLSHATRLRDESTPKKPFKSIKGLWADLGISISAEEIDEMRREMWKNFPREDI